MVHTAGTALLVAPTGLAAAVIQTPFSVNLTWTNVTDAPPATGKTIQRATDPGFASNVTTFSAATAGAASYADVTVVSGTTYWYRVRVVGSGSPAAVSAWSLPVSVTPVATLAAPSALTAVVVGPPLGVTLGWVNNASAPPATGVTVQRATNAGFTLNVTTFPSLAAISTTYADTTAAAGTTYYYRVQATGAGGIFSAWSTPAASVTTPAPPPAPTNFSVASISRASISAAWSNGGGATSNLVQYTSSGSTGPWTTAMTVSGTATSAKITGLISGRTYWVRILATNAAGSTSSTVLATRVQ
jgi:hypothetical protein